MVLYNIYCVHSIIIKKEILIGYHLAKDTKEPRDASIQPEKFPEKSQKCSDNHFLLFLFNFGLFIVLVIMLKVN